MTPCNLEESEVSVFVGEGSSPLSEDAVWHVQHVTTAVVLLTAAGQVCRGITQSLPALDLTTSAM